MIKSLVLSSILPDLLLSTTYLSLLLTTPIDCVSVMFPDSKIAKEYACAHTKVAALITHALAPAVNGSVIEACQKQPWRNMVGFASDSASVMVGKRNSVLSRVIQQQGDVFSMGCVCHLAALCATGGLKKLPVSVD